MINIIFNTLDNSILILILVFIIIPASLLCLYIFIIVLKRFSNVKRNINIDNKQIIKKPVLSAVLSIIFPGLGQIYIREIDRGVIYIGLTLLTCLFLFFTFSLTADLVLPGETGQIVNFFISTLLICFLIFLYISSVIDAYRTATAINRKILRIMRENANHLMGLMKSGRALYNRQHYQDAVELYTAIISLYPTYALAHYNRAVVYYKIHNYAKAGIDFISAAKLGHIKSQRIVKAEGIENLKF